MKRTISLLAGLGLWLAAAGAAEAACYADYKALNVYPFIDAFHVVEIDVSPCRMSEEVEEQVKRRVTAGGWTLLQVQSVFGDDGLAGRKNDAGEYFLRF